MEALGAQLADCHPKEIKKVGKWHSQWHLDDEAETNYL